MSGMLDHLKGQYAIEFERRDRLQNSLSAGLGILTLIVSAFVYLAGRIILIDSWAAYGTFFALVVSAAAFICCAGFLWAAYHGFRGHSYFYLPPARIQLGYYETCLKFYAEYPNKEELAWKGVQTHLLPVYQRSIDLNKAKNNTRFDSLTKANLLILLMLSSLAVAIVCNGKSRLQRFDAKVSETPSSYFSGFSVILKEPKKGFLYERRTKTAIKPAAAAAAP